MAKLTVRKTQKKTYIFLDGMPISHKCLSCNIWMNGADTPVAVLTVLCDDIDARFDECEVKQAYPKKE